MIKGEKILVTGPAGQIAEPICRTLARDNEVWGIARFSQPGSRERVEAFGVKALAVDLQEPDFSQLPGDFGYVLHLAANLSPTLDYDAAIRVNAESTGLLMRHCRDAKAFLAMTTNSVYKAHGDPWHLFTESDPLGDANLPAIPTYSVSKIGEEAVARTCSRLFDLPLTIARMNVAYGDNGGLPAFHLDAIVAGKPVNVRYDPSPYSLIHEDDIADHLPALLASATIGGTIVNWCGDEAVTAQQWCEYMGELTGQTATVTVTEVPNSQRGGAADPAKRASITGPCKVSWRDGVKRMVAARHPEALRSPTVP